MYPHVQVLVLDVVQPPLRAAPQNLHFKISDVTLGLRQFHNCFDFVCVQFVLGGMKGPEGVIRDLFNCLKPGGAMYVMDEDPVLYNHDRSETVVARLPNERVHSAIRRSWITQLLKGSWMARALQGESTINKNV